MGPEHWESLKESLQKKLGQKASLKDIKNEMETNNFYTSLLDQIKSSAIGVESNLKYQNARTRAQNLDKTKCHIVKKVMTKARARFLGCVPLKLKRRFLKMC